MNRGSAHRPITTQSNPFDFNEAPIHESGKSECPSF